MPQGVTKRSGSYSWNVSYKGERHTGTEKTESLAVASRKRTLELLELGKDPNVVALKEKPWTLQEAFDYCAKMEWAGKKAERNLVGNGRVVVRYFGPLRALNTIEYTDWEEYIAFARSENKSDGTINRHRSGLSKMVTCGIKMRKMGKDYFKPSFRHLNEGQGRLRYYTKDEEELILNTARVWGLTDLYDAIVVLLDTGLRLSELLGKDRSRTNKGLTKRDYSRPRGDGKGSIRVVESKNGKPRVVYLTSRANEIIELRSQGVRDADALFELPPQRAQGHFKKIRNHLGFESDEQFVLHTCRHTCASRLVIAGVHLLVVKDMLGHSDLKTTMRYAHLSNTQLQASVGVLENFED